LAKGILLIPAGMLIKERTAGMSRMPFAKFMFYSTAGTVIWTSFLAYLGFHFSENQALMMVILQRISYIIFALVLLYILWWIIKKFYLNKSNHS